MFFTGNITSKIYRLRAEILCRIFQKAARDKSSIDQIDCICTAGYISSKILLACPSITYSLICHNACSDIISKMNVLLMDYASLSTIPFDDVIRSNVNISSSCPKCNFNMKSIIQTAGNYRNQFYKQNYFYYRNISHFVIILVAGFVKFIFLLLLILLTYFFVIAY